jgi:branched-chain amino acid transport system permease protein
MRPITIEQVGRRLLPRSRSAGQRPPSYAAHQGVTIIVFAALTIVITLGLVTSDVWRNLENEWLIYGIAALGFYLMFCVAGRFAFCQPFMMTLAAYTTAKVAAHHSTWLAIGAGVAITAVFAVVFGILLARTDDFFFSIGTLALVQVGATVFLRWNDFTGPNGLTTNVPAPSVFGKVLITQKDLFWFFLAFFVLTLFICTAIERSPLTREAIAARDLPEVSRSWGVRSRQVTLAMFVIGSGLGGLAGALAVLWTGSVGTDSFGVTLAIGLLLMPIIGGVHSMWGTVVGALLYVMLPELLSGLSRYAPLAYGVILVVTIIALPDGLLGAARNGLRLATARVMRRSTGPKSTTLELTVLDSDAHR